MTMARKKYAGLDISKFLCALVILFYHFFSEHGPIPALLEDMLSLYAVCVALFMVISGFLLYDKLLLIDDEKERWNVVKKQVIRILRVYLIWSVPYLIYSILRWDFNSISLSFVLWQIQGWVFGSTFYTIWFMPALAIGMLISFYTIEKLPKALAFILAGFAYVIGSLNLTYDFLVSNFSWYEGLHRFVEVWMNGARGQFLFGFPLVTLGYVVAKNKEKFKLVSSGLLAVAFMGGLLAEALILRRFIGHTGIDMLVLMIPATFFITGFLISIPIPWFDGCSWMRKMSVLIFMSQRVFLTVLPSLFVTINKLYDTQYVAFIVACGGTILFSIIVVFLSRKYNVLKILY